MAPARRSSFSLIYTGILLAVVLLPDFLRAGPVRQQQDEEVSAVSTEGRGQGGVARSRRSLMLPQFKRMPDFWVWYKYFMETGNQEGVEDLDRMYRNYLHNKHRSEEGPTFNHYLTHLSEIYKACADSDDPECIAESTSKPKAKTVMPANVKAASVAVCNPFYDPYCLYPMLPKGVSAAPEPAAPAPAKVPAPILTPLLPVPLKSPSGYFYYAPVLEPFLTAEQKAELLRICNPADVECLQYHLRAAYGYRPAPPGPLPSYSALGCDPAKDPYCKPLLVKKAPSGYFHLYPTCDPEVDPLCVSNVAAPVPAATSEEQPPPAPSAKEQHCNPLFDEGCNPLTAAKLAGLTKPVLEYPPPKAAPQPAPIALACDPRYDPYCLFRGAAAALRRPPQLLPQYEVRSRLGVRGKTKDGYDCYVHYDQGCTPLEAGDDAEAAAPPAAPGPAPAGPACHPYDPSCGNFSPAGAPAAAAAKDGVILPDPHCDPEIDYNCRLRRADPAPVAAADEPARQGEEPQQEAAAEPHPYAVPRFEDFLRGYMSQYQKK